MQEMLGRGALLIDVDGEVVEAVKQNRFHIYAVQTVGDTVGKDRRTSGDTNLIGFEGVA